MNYDVHIIVEVRGPPSSHLIPRIVTVPDHESIVLRILSGFASGTVATRQSPKSHSEVLTNERVYERIDSWIYPTCRDGKKITINNVVYSLCYDDYMRNWFFM